MMLTYLYSHYLRIALDNILAMEGQVASRSSMTRFPHVARPILGGSKIVPPMMKMARQHVTMTTGTPTF